MHVPRLRRTDLAFWAHRAGLQPGQSVEQSDLSDCSSSIGDCGACRKLISLVAADAAWGTGLTKWTSYSWEEVVQRNICIWFLCLLLTGCSATITHEVATNDGTGIRYYEQSPYLIVYSNSKNGLKWQIVYLPDPTKKMMATPHVVGGRSELTMFFPQNGVLTNNSEVGDTTAIPKAIIAAASGPLCRCWHPSSPRRQKKLCHRHSIYKHESDWGWDHIHRQSGRRGHSRPLAAIGAKLCWRENFAWTILPLQSMLAGSRRPDCQASSMEQTISHRESATPFRSRCCRRYPRADGTIEVDVSLPFPDSSNTYAIDASSWGE